MPEHTLQRLLDRLAIEEVLIAYCRALDDVDLEAVERLFTQGCVVSYGPEARLNHRGAAEVARALARMWRFEASSHHLSNVVIAFEDDDHAAASSTVFAWHRLPDGTETEIYGEYRDRLARTAEGWRIAERKMLMNGASRSFRVGIHPRPRRPPPPDLDLAAITPREDER